MDQPEIRTLIESYLDAFAVRDLDRCVDSFRSDASLEWMMGVYGDRNSIEEWHKDRFEADLKILKVESIEVEDSTVTVDVVVNSKRLAAWRLPSLSGRVTVEFLDGKIHRLKFAAKSINPQQDWS